MLDEQVSDKPLVPWILMASYIYYRRPDLDPIISDTMYDAMCRILLDNWDDIEHMHKNLITKEDLKSGTLYRLLDHDYPTICKQSAIILAEDGEI